MEQITLWRNPPKRNKVELEWITFPSGEQHLRLGIKRPNDKYLISASLTDNNSLIKLLLLNGKLKQEGVKHIELFIKYFPCARQDRKAIPSDVHASAVMCEFINNMNFNKVYVLDPHSKESVKGLNNSYIISNKSFIHSVVKDFNNKYTFCLPDKGAKLKYESVLYELNNRDEIVFGTKFRDSVSGNLVVHPPRFSPELVYAPHYWKFIVVDDICDGGGTFIPSLKYAKEQGLQTILAVTHGLFTKGLNELLKYVDIIHTTDSTVNALKYKDNLRVKIHYIDDYMIPFLTHEHIKND